MFSFTPPGPRSEDPRPMTLPQARPQIYIYVVHGMCVCMYVCTCMCVTTAGYPPAWPNTTAENHYYRGTLYIEWEVELKDLWGSFKPVVFNPGYT